MDRNQTYGFTLFEGNEISSLLVLRGERRIKCECMLEISFVNLFGLVVLKYSFRKQPIVFPGENEVWNSKQILIRLL